MVEAAYLHSLLNIMYLNLDVKRLLPEIATLVRHRIQYLANTGGIEINDLGIIAI